MCGETFVIPYGDGFISVSVRGAVLRKPRYVGGVGVEEELKIIDKSLESPIGTSYLSDLVDSSSRVVLLVSDITRPCPSNKVVPIILKKLLSCGVKKDDISIVFATGIHRPHTMDEWVKLLGVDVVRSFKVLDHNAFDSSGLVYVGRTSRGTPVEVNSLVFNSDLRIGVANVDPHYFAGYSGGGKSVLPGVSSYVSIRENHKMMLLPGAELARLEGNPVREDIEEAASIVGLEYIVNVVLSESKEVLGCFSGHFIKAHREAVRFFNEIYGVEVGRKYDIVIASPGGFPKDINLYQAHKALEVALKCVRPGGVIILLAECREGVGDKKTEELLYSGLNPEEVVDFVKENFDLGYHKAYAIARIATKSNILIVSKNIKDSKLYKRFNNFDEALKYAYELVGSGDSLVLPYASSTIPKDLI
jgi:nickel-dependent lactate racemase